MERMSNLSWSAIEEKLASVDMALLRMLAGNVRECKKRGRRGNMRIDDSIIKPAYGRKFYFGLVAHEHF